jgi:hypothetical protein
MFLVFQTDSMMFKRHAHLMDSFLEYDYVGAPWSVTEYPPTMNCNFIGNGGFSLRRKSKMLEIIEKIDWHQMEFPYNLEDLYFSTNYNTISVKKPDYKKALTFCVDEVFSEKTFACHRAWCHTHFNLFTQIYPECETLYKLQESEV